MDVSSFNGGNASYQYFDPPQFTLNQFTATLGDQSQFCNTTTSTENSNNSNCLPTNGDQQQQSFIIKYKTEMCRNWELTGECRFGDSCAFAHGGVELQKKKHVPTKYKTRLCKQYHQSLYCPYGLRCQFVHSQLATNNNGEEVDQRSYSQILEEMIHQDK